ncbi:helix-turn-helix domain-containing protein [Marispirochaeta sp.]|jgi:two-component system, response regulator YesN|uniref:AraC family transcriptional regulator n=1 Tax=Marispirochaeta sp. TaxID=2038653 RepID=UPI0029C6D2C8|nr:helix-turn-helix domain-containing protein [Marispirochaeta sp.]
MNGTQAETQGNTAEKHKRKTLLDILKPSRTRYKKKTFLKIFSFNVIISFFILVLTVTALYYSFKNLTTREIHNKSIDLLNQTELIFNSLHAWIIPSFRQIKSEETIATLIHSESIDRMSISKGLDRLDSVMTSYYLLHSIYIFNNQSGQFYSTINGYEADDCSDFTLPLIIYNIREYGVYKYIPRKITYRMNNNIFSTGREEIMEENVFSIIVGDIPGSAKTINGALIVNISERRIREYFLGAGLNTSGELLVIDNVGTVLTHPDQKEFGSDYSGYSYAKRILESDQSEGVFIDTIGETKHLVSYITHPTWEWHFINITPYDTIFADLNDFLNAAVIVFLLLASLAVLLAYVSSRNIYSPISRLFHYSLLLKEKYKESDLTDYRKKPGELQELDRIFKQIAKRVEDADHYLEDFREFNKKEVFKNLLLGELDLGELESHTEFIKSELDTGPYMLSVVRLDDYKNIIVALNAEEVTRLFNIIHELISHYLPFNHYFLHIRTDQACIVCNLNTFTHDTGTCNETIRELFASLKEGIRVQLGYTITIALSNVFTDIDEFHSEYKRTFQASQYRFRFGHNACIHVREIAARDKKNYLLPEKEIDKMFNEVKLGRISEVEKILNCVFSEVREYNYEDFTYLVQFMTYKTRKVIEEVKESLVQAYINLAGLIDEIESFETLEQIQNKFLEIYTLLIDNFQTKQSNKALQLAEKARQYIDDNYTDVNLCSEGIADIMGFSTHYIRYTFRNVFDVSIMEYINSKRLDFCKRQLKETRHPIKKIYKLAGYSNYSYFFTLFKKKTGLTPNQYKLRHR